MAWLKTLLRRGRSSLKDEAGRNEAPAVTQPPVIRSTAAAAQKEIAILALTYILRRRQLPTGAIEVVSISQVDRPQGNPSGSITLLINEWNMDIAFLAPKICSDLLVQLDRFEHAVNHSDFKVTWSFATNVKVEMPKPVLREIVRTVSKPGAPAAAKPFDASATIPQPRPVHDLLDDSRFIATRQTGPNNFARSGPEFAITDIMLH